MSDVKAVEFEFEIKPAKPRVDLTFDIVLNVPEAYKKQALEIINKQGWLGRGVIEFVEPGLKAC